MTRETVAVVSHDAGGAEILASYVARSGLLAHLVLEGPAQKVFTRRLGPRPLETLEHALAACDWCLCGTGWQSDLEWRAIKRAREAGKRVVAFLDHWVNYRDRFCRHGELHLPDEIWVGDVTAEQLAKTEFPQTTVRLVQNPYFLDLREKIMEFPAAPSGPSGEGKRILYVCENISDHAALRHGDPLFLGYTEWDAIEYFLRRIDVLQVRVESVTLRPHPSDPPEKYDGIVARNAGLVRLSAGGPLLNEIMAADIVVGCNSMALVVGLVAGRRVVSCVPPPGAKCNLPKDIECV